MGEMLPVGEVLGAASDAWDTTQPPGSAPSPSARSRRRRPRLAAVPDTAVTWRPAGFWMRAVACVFDAAAVAIGATLLSLPFGSPTTPRGSLVAAIAAFVLALLVPLVGWTLWGTTPGKRVLNLSVVGPDGRHSLPVGRALLRLLGYFPPPSPLAPASGSPASPPKSAPSTTTLPAPRWSTPKGGGHLTGLP